MKKKKQPKRSSRCDVVVMVLRRGNYTEEEIAQRTNLSRATVRRAIRDLGLVGVPARNGELGRPSLVYSLARRRAP